MKQCLFIVFNFISGSLCAQNIQAENQILFSIECHKIDTVKTESIKFILSLKNNTGQTLTMPSEFFVGPVNAPGCDIHYEVEYCTADDSVSIFSGISRIFPDTRLGDVTLSNGMLNLFSTNVWYDRTDFKQKGIYRIRFILKSSAIRNLKIKNITTEWIYIEL